MAERWSGTGSPAIRCSSPVPLTPAAKCSPHTGRSGSIPPREMEGHRDQTTWVGRISEIGSRYEEPVYTDGDRQQDIYTVSVGTDQTELGWLMVKTNALGEAWSTWIPQA